MSPKTPPPAEPARRPMTPMSRTRVVLAGVALGALWGSFMWFAFEIAGRESGVRGWAYLAFTMAMIGGGVAGVFGATGAKRSGERISPRVRRTGKRGRRR